MSTAVLMACVVFVDMDSDLMLVFMVPIGLILI